MERETETYEKTTKNIEISPFLEKKTPKEGKTKKIEKKEKSKRVITSHDSWIEDLSFENQYRILNEVKTQYSHKDPYHRFFVSQIKGKIYGYS